jgi:hypothetical protein
LRLTLKNQLLRALIDPGTDQADLVVREFRGAFALGHEGIRVTDMGDGQNEIAMGAVANRNHFAIPSAFQCASQSIERQTGPGFLAIGMAFIARSIKDRLDVGIEGHALLGGGDRQFSVIGSGRESKTERDSQGGEGGFGQVHCL